MDYKVTIQRIMVTLEGVKADGADNWNRLLACHQELQNMLAMMSAEEIKEK